MIYHYQCTYNILGFAILPEVGETFVRFKILGIDYYKFFGLRKTEWRKNIILGEIKGKREKKKKKKKGDKWLEIRKRKIYFKRKLGKKKKKKWHTGRVAIAKPIIFFSDDYEAEIALFTYLPPLKINK